MKGLIARKLGMTQVFVGENLVPVTVLETGNIVTGKKTKENDGYDAVVLGFGEIKEKNVNKPMKGQFKKAGVGAKRVLKEIRFDEKESDKVLKELNLADSVNVDIFKVGEKVDVTSVSKGKGFQGPIKRHGQSRGPETHGSHYHRGPGAMAMCADPGRVLKGKSLAGHMGARVTTIKNLEIIDVLADKNVILIKGNVPGAKKSFVTIKEAQTESK